MAIAEIQFDILSYWHAGSGSGQGADLDAVVVKSAAGLPCLPGKTVKGLCRDAVVSLEELGRVGKVSEDLFGSATQIVSRYDTDPGMLRFSNATPVDVSEAWAKNHPAAACALFAQLSATKIADNGLAADKSLRKIEVAIPLTLTARIEADDNDKRWIEILRQAAPLIRSLGSHRRRGLGRVQVLVQEVTT